MDDSPPGGTSSSADQAVDRERAALEERIARLTEANAATDRALQRLAEDTTPDGFVRNLQRAMIELLGGRCSAQFRVNRNVLLGGVIFADGDFVPDDPLVGLRASDVPSWSTILANPQPTVMMFPGNADQMDEFTVSFMKERGFSWLVNFPLFVSGKPAWILAVLGDTPARLTAENLDRFAALSRQLTLALQLNHMHEETRAHERARAIAEERTSMARDIHDTLAQGFAAICIRLQAAQHDSRFSDAPEAVRKHIAASLEVSTSHAAHARHAIRCLRQESDESFRLDEALKVTITQIGMDMPLTSRLQFPASPVPNAIGLELLRITQEALTNAAKHSGASRITLQVSPAAADGIMIGVADNGAGFNQDRRSGGYGLIGMQERANRIQARLTIASRPGAGTEVVVVWSPESRPGSVGEPD